MHRLPLVSFCMSTYKRPDRLKTQLHTILLQTYSNFEVIISDNDEAKSAKDIVECFADPRLRYFSNDGNIGMISSFNKSIERSKGEFIVMITDDDPIYPSALQTLTDLSNQYPNYGIYAGCGDWIIDNNSASDTQKLKIGVHPQKSPQLLANEVKIIQGDNFIYEYINGILREAFLLWSCAMVRREVVLSINGVPDYGSEFLADHAYMISVSSPKGMVYVNKSLGGQLVHGANFGYEFYKLVNKYINTPIFFYNYLKQHFSDNRIFHKNDCLLWNYIGRCWVEYSLMVYYSLKGNKKLKRDFFDAFNLAFSNKKMRKWKYKFYVKAYLRPLFNLSIKAKQLILKY